MQDAIIKRPARIVTGISSRRHARLSCLIAHALSSPDPYRASTPRPGLVGTSCTMPPLISNGSLVVTLAALPDPVRVSIGGDLARAAARNMGKHPTKYQKWLEQHSVSDRTHGTFAPRVPEPCIVQSRPVYYRRIAATAYAPFDASRSLSYWWPPVIRSRDGIPPSLHVRKTLLRAARSSRYRPYRTFQVFTNADRLLSDRAPLIERNARWKTFRQRHD